MPNVKLTYEELVKQVEKLTNELIIANKELALQNELKEIRADELDFAKEEKGKRADELDFAKEEKGKRAAELIIINKEIILKNKKLFIQNKELEQFAYITSHDLQEPLRSLICFTELIQNEYKNKLDEQADTYLDFIAKSSNRMQELVKGLLDYSRIGKEKVICSVDCNIIVKEVLSDLTLSIRESNAKITVNDLPILNGYSTELRQLFQNLISNAIKFRKKDIVPEILISASKQDKMWHFVIQDNGIGIEEKYKEKIFIIFKRIHNRTEYEGTGIGLSFCKKIVELHNGSIWFESKNNEGSTFNFTIQ
jgi:light-regulated signal transduction histidine kinase (bacteriophytochrome)